MATVAERLKVLVAVITAACDWNDVVDVDGFDGHAQRLAHDTQRASTEDLLTPTLPSAIVPTLTR